MCRRQIYICHFCGAVYKTGINTCAYADHVASGSGTNFHREPSDDILARKNCQGHLLHRPEEIVGICGACLAGSGRR
jgi:hypothetical protein